MFLFQKIQKFGGKAEIALLEFSRILRPVDSGKMKDKISISAPFQQQLFAAVTIVAPDLLNPDRMHMIIAILNCLQRCTEIFTDEAVRPSYQNPHIFSSIVIILPYQAHTVTAQRESRRFLCRQFSACLRC